MHIILKSFLLLLFFCGTANAATYYVATTGNDTTGDGSIGNPWLTLAQACTVDAPGDTIYLRGGTYTTVQSCTNIAGTAGSRVTISAYPGETVTITTAETVSSWTPNGTNKYLSNSMALGASFNNLGSPANSVYAMWKDTTILTIASSVTAESEVRIIDLGSGNAQFEIYTTSDPSLSTYRLVGTGGTKSYVGATFSGSYFDVSGINTQYNYFGYQMGVSNNYTVSNFTVSYTGPRGITLPQSSGNPHYNGTWSNGEIHHTCSSQSSTAFDQNSHGFKFAADTDNYTNGTYMTIDNIYSHDNCYHGFQVSEGWDGITIKNSRAGNNNLRSRADGSDYRIALSQTAGTIGNNIFDNTSEGGTTNGFYLGGGIINTLLYNNIITSPTTCGIKITDFSDTAGGRYGSGNKVYNNIIKDSLRSGLCVSTRTATAYASNNTIINSALYGIELGSANTGVDIKNNVITVPTGASAVIMTGPIQQSAITIPNGDTYNRVFGSTAYSFEWVGQLDASADPLVTSPTFFDKSDGGMSNAQEGWVMYLDSGDTLHIISVAAIPFIDPRDTVTSTTVTRGVPLSIIGTWTAGGAWKIYIDGVEASYSQAQTFTNWYTDDTDKILTIGNARGQTRVAGGKMNKFRIWRNKALSAGEVTTVYGGGTATGLTGEYLFTDGSGTTLTDSSGNANNGTLNSYATWSGADVIFSNGYGSFPGTLNYNAFYSPDASPFSYNGTSYSFANYKTATSQDANSISQDFTSDFTNYAGGDYTLKSTATIKDLGTTLSDVTHDYVDTFRPQGLGYSIGAYEEAGSGGGTGVRGMSLTGMVVN